MKISGGKISIKGEFEVPGDKSISHRSIMLGSIAEGKTNIKNFLMGEDCLSTIKCFKDMGVNIEVKEDEVIVDGVGLRGLKKSENCLDVGNSGTTIRIMSGILAAQNFESKITGDESICKRPMKRIIRPLKMMGANIEGVNGNYAPLSIKPVNSLNEMRYKQEVASAQVKSCILMAGLYAEGQVQIVEEKETRDHTERMMRYFGVDVNKKEDIVMIETGGKLVGKEVYVPGDISSAAFLMVLALITEESDILIKNVGVNPTRTGIIDALRQMGAYIEIKNKREVSGEEVADLRVKYSEMIGTDISGDIIPRMIDEIPVFAVACAFAKGESTITGAEELKHKESNRIKSVVKNLESMGINIEELEDGMKISGGNDLKATHIKAHKDHRIAMALTIAALNANEESTLDDKECVYVSFPGFFNLIEKISGKKLFY